MVVAPAAALRAMLPPRACRRQGLPRRPRAVGRCRRRSASMPPLPTSGPLAGLTVLDLTWVLSGPYCAMTLADLGADVIKVERPPYGDIARTTGPFLHADGAAADGGPLEESAYFYSINRGKRSIALDLRSDRGRE